MSTLRIVTGHDAAGLAELQTIGAPPGAEPFTHTPGFAVARVWHTRQTPVIEPAPRDEAATRASVLPEPGETTALVVTFPPDAALAAAAIDPQQAAAEFAARVPGLAEAVRFPGYLDEGQVADLLATADMLVLPSFAEGLPVVLMEALAARIPVIATQIAGVPELVVAGTFVGIA